MAIGCRRILSPWIFALQADPEVVCDLWALKYGDTPLYVPRIVMEDGTKDWLLNNMLALIARIHADRGRIHTAEIEKYRLHVLEDFDTEGIRIVLKERVHAA